MRILLLGDRIWGRSAYSKVLNHTAKWLLSEGHEVGHIPMSMAMRGGKFKYEGVLVHPSGNHPFCEDVNLFHYIDFNADMIITAKEPWVFSHLHNSAVNFVPLAIIDHSPVNFGITTRLHTAFRVIAVSRFGQRELKQADIDSTYVPHGVPTDVYKVLDEEERDKCRKMFFIEEDEFMPTIVAMNRARKLIPRMMRGYKRFLDNNPDVKSHLMLWTDVRATRRPEDADMVHGVSDVGVDMVPEIMQLGIGEEVRWPERKWIYEGLPEWAGDDYVNGHDMVKLYNASDVNFLCSGGEAAGLTYLESAACGVMSLCTDYAGAPEYVGPGLTVPASDYIVQNTPGTRYMLPSIDKMAEGLAKMMNTDRAKASRRARRHAERYDWTRVLDRYLKPLLDECEGELRPLITKKGASKW